MAASIVLQRVSPIVMIRRNNNHGHSHPPHIPLEILREILLFAAERLPVRGGANTYATRARSLLRYTLVCRAWACAALPLLYQSVVVPVQKPDPFACCMRSLSAFGESVEELKVQDPHPGPGKVVEGNRVAYAAEACLAWTLSLVRGRSARRRRVIEDPRWADGVDTATECLSLCHNVRRVILDCRKRPKEYQLELLLEALQGAERIKHFEWKNSGHRVLLYNDVLAILERIPQVAVLHLTRASFSSFPTLRYLVSLSLQDVPIRDYTLVAILSSQANLRHLRIECMSCSDVSPSCLAQALKLVSSSLVSLHLALHLTDHPHPNELIFETALSSLLCLESFEFRTFGYMPTFNAAVFGSFPPCLRVFHCSAPLWNLTADVLASHITTLSSRNLKGWSVEVGVNPREWGSESSLRKLCKRRGLALKRIDTRRWGGWVKVDDLKDVPDSVSDSIFDRHF